LDQQVPPEFPTANDRRSTLREILTYQAYDEAWIPDMMAGRTVDEVGAETYGAPLENDLLGDDPKTGYGELLTRAVAAVRAIDDADLDGRTVHYSYGDYPVREALWHAIIFRATHAYDIARMIGVESRLPDDLVASVWAIVEPHAEEWREMGVFGPRVDVPESAPLQDRLLGLTGRTPA
jgi:uncharacterized protein (TIGR03086 family)